MTRGRSAAALALVAAGAGALVFALALALGARATRPSGGQVATPALAGEPLDGRLGGHVSSFDRRYGGAGQVDAGPFRRIYVVPEGRLLLDLARTQHVRQVTLGRDREVNDARQPDPGDWSLDHARALARAYLPPDATLVRGEPFFFRDQNAGLRDVYRSPALAAVIPAEIYAEHNAAGPPGLCAVTYYQTTTGNVAFLLVGLQ